MMEDAATPLLDDRFLLFEALGQGGMGRVYRAFDRAERRWVALKIPDATEQAGPSHPLSAEFEVWCRLRHPNIVRAYELKCARKGPVRRGTPYLVLESFAGRPANRALPPGRVAPEVLEQLARRTLRALGHVHRSRYVHRDVKPANLLVDVRSGRLGRVKLTDFGLASTVGRSGECGRVSGSLPYVSPEGVLGLPLDGRADLYGFGIVLYLLATGRMPVDARDLRALIRWHLAGPPADPRPLRPSVPERLARLIERLTERDPDRRPATAEHALSMLGGRPPTVSRASPLPVAKSERAMLRLAFDAVRQGARRQVRLPRARRSAAVLVSEACVLAQVHGMALHRVRAAGRRGESSLARAVLRILLERGPEAPRLAERYELLRDLPLVLLGGVPFWNPTSPPTDSAPAEVGKRIAGFVLEASSREAMALVVERGALTEPAVASLAERLAASVAAQPGSPDGRGGLLLLLPDPGPAALERATGYEQPLVEPQFTQT